MSHPPYMPQQPSYLQAGVPNNNNLPESKFIIDDGGDGLSSDDMCYVTNTTVYVVAFAQVSNGGQVVYSALNVEQKSIQLANDMLPPTIFMKMETAANCLAHIRANAGNFLTPFFFQQNMIQEGSLPVIIELEYGYKFITEADRMRRQQMLNQSKPVLVPPNYPQQQQIPQGYPQQMQPPMQPNYPQQPLPAQPAYPQQMQPNYPQQQQLPVQPAYPQQMQPPTQPNYPQQLPAQQQIIGYDPQGNPIWGQPNWNNNR
jgi:hypothetical protein